MSTRRELANAIRALAMDAVLGKLIVCYDHNGTSIDGRVEGWFRGDTAKRFEAYCGHVLPDVDYARNAVRLACLRATRVVLVYTHDSIGLGEDGPTHQPIEHLTSLRAMPGMTLWRPCDGVETAVSWAAAPPASLEHSGPTALILTRQALPPQPRRCSMLRTAGTGKASCRVPAGDASPSRRGPLLRSGAMWGPKAGLSGSTAAARPAKVRTCFLTSGSQSIMCVGRSRIC